MGRFRAGLIASILIGATAIVGTATLVPFARSDTPTVSASPNAELVDRQYVDVGVTGERPGYIVRVRECPGGATDVSQCNADSQSLQLPGDSRLITARPDGTGSTPFYIAAGDLVDTTHTAFRCDHDHPCELDAFETDDYGNDIGFSNASRSTIQFGASTVACPPGNEKSRISGSGATAPAADVVEWESEVCGAPYSLNVSYAITNSPNGKAAFIQGLTDSDYAISTIPLKSDELDQLKQQNRDVVQIPITIGSLAFVYNYYEVVNRCNGNDVPTRITNLRLSPATIIGILTGHITDMSDQRIADDNPDLVAQFRTSDCQTVTHLPSRLIQAVGRADNSGATWTLSSWAMANAPDVWESNGPGFRTGSTEIFPAGNGVDLRTGNRAVATDVRTAGGTTDRAAGTMWFGYVDSSVSRQLGLPNIAVKTAKGSWVQPTPDSVTAGLAAATLNQDGTISPNYTPSDANAYPLVTVSYLITDKARLTQARAATMKAFAAYAISKGQEAATLRGYIPLSDELKSSASAQTAEITYDPNATDPSSGGKKKKHHGSGSGSGSTPAGLPQLASGGRSDNGTTAGDIPGDTASDLTGALLASASGGDHLSAKQLAAISPISGGPVATQVLGPAGGPAGVVRALTVFLGVPMLVLLGCLCLFIGSGDKLFALVRGRVSLHGWRVRWHAT